MTEVMGSVFKKVQVHLDNVHYKKCTFDECLMIYSATGPVGLTGCTLNECTWTFQGAAAETISFLTAFYKMSPQLVEQTFENIRSGKHQPVAPPDEFPDSIQ